jgi:hypothetical protein
LSPHGILKQIIRRPRGRTTTAHRHHHGEPAGAYCHFDCFLGRDVIELFREARTAQMPLAEVSLHYGSLRITARELRGGAIIFLFPQTALFPTPTPARP